MDTSSTRDLVLLHGFTGSPASWDGVRRYLASDSTHALALATVGHDGATGPDVASFEAEVDRLAGSIREAGLQRPHLAGYSMGGRLALGLLVRHPALFSGATLIGASPGLPDPPPDHPDRSAALEERRRRAAWDAEWARLLETEGLSTFVAAWEALPMFASQRELPPAARAEQERIRRSHHPLGLARAMRAVGLAAMPDYRPWLDRVRTPTRLVAGERDAKFRRLAGEMAERMPRADVVVVEDAGHNVVLEQPEVVARLIRQGMERA